jgi:hypothetical protein
MSADLLIRNAEVDGRICDVRIEKGVETIRLEGAIRMRLRRTGLRRDPAFRKSQKTAGSAPRPA